MVESGQIMGNETRSHKMELPMDKSDSHEFNVRLHLISGDADLYMKVCSPKVSCELTKEDMANPQSLMLRKSTEKVGIKTVNLNAQCVSPDGVADKPGFAITNSCMFGIYVLGVNKNGKGKIHYELSVEDSNESHLMVKDHFLKIK